MEIKYTSNGAIEFLSVLFSTFISLFFGTWIPVMTTLLVLNATDVATGLLKGRKKHTIGSNEFYQGIKKKVGQWMLIIVANAIDTVAFDNMPVAKTGVVGTLIGVEGISITENLAEIGVPVSDSITKYLVQIRQSSEERMPREINDKENTLDN